MDKEINGHLYITNDNLKRIADALEEILRLVKKDMEPRTKKKTDENK